MTKSGKENTTVRVTNGIEPEDIMTTRKKVKGCNWIQSNKFQVRG